MLYSLACASFTKADLRRLDGFQNRCLRKVWGIKPAFVSRVSNAHVLATVKHPKASELLLQRQLVLFGKVVRASPDHPMRSAAFFGSTWEPITKHYVRKVGRPRKEWVSSVKFEAMHRFGSMDQIASLAQDPAGWKRVVRSSF